MAKGKTNITGLTTQWRKGKKNDSLRIFVYKNGEYISISAKVHPTLKQINNYLKSNQFRMPSALLDSHFQALYQRLQYELKEEHGLKSYRIQEKLDLIKKSFNFESSLNEFEQHKSDISCSHGYRTTMEKFWLPYFLIEKKCEHPRDFKKYKKHCISHVKNALNKHGEKYSVHSYNGLTKALNQYLKFLEEYEYINSSDSFKVFVNVTLEQKKRGLAKPKRSQDTYSLNELIEIKSKIDLKYHNTPKKKLRAYALYFGVCIGQRRGNFLGLRAENLHPNDDVPNFELKDNIICGWSRGESGSIVMENCTKTAYLGDNNKPTQIPFIQPSKEILTEVAQYLAGNLKPSQRLLKCHPDSVNRFWMTIAK